MDIDALGFSSDSDADEPKSSSSAAPAAVQQLPTASPIVTRDGAAATAAPSAAPQYNEADLIDEPENTETQTAIQNRYVFWFMQRQSKSAVGNDNFDANLQQIASFQTVQHFWRVYDHVQRATSLPQMTDLHLFKDGIKPTWEDPNNKQGGKWIIRLRKGLAARYWEELLLGIVGEQFDVGNEVCGTVLSIRYNEDIISIWNRNADNTEATSKIRDHMRRLLRLPAFISTEYKRHADALSDKSSFRNTTVWRGGSREAREGGKGPRGGAMSGDDGPGRGPPRGSNLSGQGAGGKRDWSKDWSSGPNASGSAPPPQPTRDLNAKWR